MVELLRKLRIRSSFWSFGALEPRQRPSPTMTKAKRSRRVAQALLAAPILLSGVDGFVQRPTNGGTRRDPTQASTTTTRQRLPTPVSPPAGWQPSASSTTSDERSRTMGLGVASSACELCKNNSNVHALCCFLHAYLISSTSCAMQYSSPPTCSLTHHFFTPHTTNWIVTHFLPHAQPYPEVPSSPARYLTAIRRSEVETATVAAAAV